MIRTGFGLVELARGRLARGSWAWVAAASLGVLLAACASTGVSAAQVEAEQNRLLAPYRQQRAVLSDELELELSANFLAPAVDVDAPVTAETALVSFPADFARSAEGGDVVYRWVGKGGIGNPLQFRIGDTVFAVLNVATMRVRGSGKNFALNAAASGHVTIGEGVASVNCQELRIENGLLNRR